MIKTTREMVLAAIFAAVMSIFSVIAVPIGPVSVTMGVFGVLFTALTLSPMTAVFSVLIFILCGAVGLPVFSGLKGGIGVLIGPTGGYIWSYIFMAVICAASVKLTESMNKKKAIIIKFCACIAAVALCYFLGTLQFSSVMEKTMRESLLICVYPFIPFDIAKSVIAVALSEQVRKRLPKSGE